MNAIARALLAMAAMINPVSPALGQSSHDQAVMPSGASRRRGGDAKKNKTSNRRGLTGHRRQYMPGKCR